MRNSVINGSTVLYPTASDGRQRWRSCDAPSAFSLSVMPAARCSSAAYPALGMLGDALLDVFVVLMHAGIVAGNGGAEKLVKHALGGPDLGKLDRRAERIVAVRIPDMGMVNWVARRLVARDRTRSCTTRMCRFLPLVVRARAQKVDL